MRRVGAALAGALAPTPPVGRLPRVAHLPGRRVALLHRARRRRPRRPRGAVAAREARGGDAIAAAGATITHHHAVGRDHAPWLEAETGALGLAALRAVKAELDPAGIMNPGKLL